MTKCLTRIDHEMIQSLITRNKLTRLGMSKSMYGGTCPFCGRERSFCLWSEKGDYRCYWCGCDGRFVATPERMAEARRQRREMLAEMVV
jgi:hypothetical protein